VSDRARIFFTRRNDTLDDQVDLSLNGRKIQESRASKGFDKPDHPRRSGGIPRPHRGPRLGQRHIDTIALWAIWISMLQRDPFMQSGAWH